MRADRGHDARARARRTTTPRRIEIDTILDLLMAWRWVHFVAMSVLFGSSLWSLIEPSGGRARPSVDRTIADRTRILARSASLAATVSGVGWMVCSLATMTGGFQSAFAPDTLSPFFFDTPFGPVLMIRLALLSALLAMAFAPVSNQTRDLSIMMLAAHLLVSQAWLGHAAQGGPGIAGAAMMIVYAIHVLAASAWAGGLPGLMVSIVAGADGGEIFAALRRYSIVATAAVIAIIATGIANTLFRTDDSIVALVSSPYGMVLFVKIGFVAAMLACAVWNRLAMLGLRDRAVDARAPSSLRVGLSFEIALGALVLGVAAILGVTPPPA